MPVDVGEVEVGKDVGVMDEYRFGAIEPLAGMENASAGVEQQVGFVGYVDGDAEIVVASEKVDNHRSEVMNINGNIVEPGCNHTENYTL